MTKWQVREQQSWTLGFPQAKFCQHPKLGVQNLVIFGLVSQVSVYQHPTTKNFFRIVCIHKSDLQFDTIKTKNKYQKIKNQNSIQNEKQNNYLKKERFLFKNTSCSNFSGMILARVFFA